MKLIYVIKLGYQIAIADLSHGFDGTDSWYIHRINVPRQFRGQGYGSKLLKEITFDADNENVELRLDINPSDGLHLNQLRDWYERYEFTGSRSLGYIRKRRSEREHSPFEGEDEKK
jgi:ribosomal protein S18 acetylase RimI-like enzyme